MPPLLLFSIDYSKFDPHNVNQFSTIGLEMRNLDPNEQPAQAGDLYLLFQEARNRNSCPWADILSRRPSHQITAALVGCGQSGVILQIEGVS